MKDIGSVRADPGGERSGEAGIENQKAHPAVEKSGTRAESFVKINVGTAGAWKTSGEFAETQRTAESSGGDNKPDDQKPKGRAKGFGHTGGREKNSDGDGFAGDCSGGGA